MTNDKADQVLRKYAELLRADSLSPVRALPLDGRPRMIVQLGHALWMCEAALMFSADKLGKKKRWLGFVQGVLWCNGVRSVDDMKRDNMPDAESEGGR